MLIRRSRLPRNQSAGWEDRTPLRTVHQSPPKKMSPSIPPPSPANATIEWFIHGDLPLLAAWPCLPWRPNARHSNSRPRARPRGAPKRPGMRARIMLVQPHARRRAEQRRDVHGPADHSRHAQAEPDALHAVAPCLDLARRLRADQVHEGISFAAVDCLESCHSCRKAANRLRKPTSILSMTRAHALFLLVEGEKLLLHRLMELAEVRAAQRPFRTETST